jgi:hypothetical protein
MPEAREVSRSVVERLTTDASWRQQFQREPVSALREAGVPEELLPTARAAGEIDLIELGRRLEAARLQGGELGAIAVACVVI